MKTIPLTKGYEALIDDSDYDSVSSHKWHYDHGYASRKEGSRKIYMHRQILLPTGKLIVDHKNRNGLDNQRDNLRACTQHENQANRTVRKDSRSGLKGVRFHKRDHLWGARIRVHNKEIHLGWFKTPELAHEAYVASASIYFGDYARAT